MDPLEYALSEIRDGLKFMGSDFATQCKSLPDYAHIADEILNAVPTDQIDFLVENKILTKEIALKIYNFVRELDELSVSDDYDEMLNYIKSKKFDIVRKRSLELLDIINQHVHKM